MPRRLSTGCAGLGASDPVAGLSERIDINEVILFIVVTLILTDGLTVGHRAAELRLTRSELWSAPSRSLAAQR
jgi:hypothetical protein